MVDKIGPTVVSSSDLLYLPTHISNPKIPDFEFGDDDADLIPYEQEIVYSCFDLNSGSIKNLIRKTYHGEREDLFADELVEGLAGKVIYFVNVTKKKMVIFESGHNGEYVSLQSLNKSESYWKQRLFRSLTPPNLVGSDDEYFVIFRHGNHRSSDQG